MSALAHAPCTALLLWFNRMVQRNARYSQSMRMGRLVTRCKGKGSGTLAFCSFYVKSHCNTALMTTYS